jgi:hypothetical protein
MSNKPQFSFHGYPSAGVMFTRDYFILNASNLPDPESDPYTSKRLWIYMDYNLRELKREVVESEDCFGPRSQDQPHISAMESLGEGGWGDATFEWSWFHDDAKMAKIEINDTCDYMVSVGGEIVGRMDDDGSTTYQQGDSCTNAFLLNEKHVLIANHGDVWSVVLVRDDTNADAEEVALMPNDTEAKEVALMPDDTEAKEVALMPDDTEAVAGMRDDM